ncbi:MAG: hypothetical protein ACTSUE_18295 [Promethearchaeota archaeon]
MVRPNPEGDSPDDVVFRVAVELLNQTKQPLNIQELFNACMQRSGLSPTMVNESIYNLIKKKFLVEGSKLTYEEMMKNPLRIKIFEHVKQHPGCRVRDIRREMGIDNAESHWHLSMLVKFGYIRRKKIGKYVAHFVADFPADYDEILCYLQHNTTYSVFYDVFVTPNSNAEEIAGRLGLHVNTVKYHIAKLSSTTLFISTIDPATSQSRVSVNAGLWGSILKVAPTLSG